MIPVLSTLPQGFRAATAYRTARTPYLREIMDALSPRHPAQRISFMKAAQVGATEAGNNWIGFVIHHAPGSMLAVLPTVEMAKRTSRGRLDPLIADSPALRERVQPARSRDAGNSMLSKEFPGGILVLTGANSATGLRSMPARYIFLDEVDAYPASADEEGDPVTLAEARTTTFSHRRYFVPCPHCGHMQWLQFERLHWDKGRPETAAYHCAGYRQLYRPGRADTRSRTAGQRAAGIIQLYMLTGARVGEVRQARFEQFNLDLGSWSKPAATTKQRKNPPDPDLGDVAATVRKRALLAWIQTSSATVDLKAAISSAMASAGVF